MTPETKRLVLMMGGPASGKSRIRKQNFTDLPVVDCDSIKESHPDYDPKNPSVLHEWSSQEATRRVFELLGAGESFVFDGTGNSSEKYVRFTEFAHEVGYVVEVCYVVTSLTEAIRRNAARTRTVPETVLRQRHASVKTSFEIVSRYVDSVSVVNN